MAVEVLEQRTGVFQSTPPARGATYCPKCAPDAVRISIHAPREGGDEITPMVQTVGLISIHAPREGGDIRQHRAVLATGISIHAPREGGDRTVRTI